MSIWLGNIDINGLSDAECDAIAHVDIEDDTQLAWLMSEWLRPRYLLWNEPNRLQMRNILEVSKEWTDKDLRRAFDDHHLPSGQEVRDIDRFMKALRDEFLK